MKTSDLCILVSVGVAFITTAYLWFNGQKEEGLFTATWIPSILTFAIYFQTYHWKIKMEDPLIFFVGLFCFVLAIVGVVMTYLEFKNIELKSKK